MRLCSSLKASGSRLVTKLLSQRNVDMYLLTSALSELPLKASLTLIKQATAKSNSQFIKILALTDIALVICHAHNQHSYIQICEKLRLDAIWGYILGLYQVWRR